MTLVTLDFGFFCGPPDKGLLEIDMRIAAKHPMTFNVAPQRQKNVKFFKKSVRRLDNSLKTESEK